MPRPKLEEELEPMNFRIEKRTLERIEKVWRTQLYRNRTVWITEAIEDKLNGIVCSFCGARNPKGGRVCSVCLRPLTANDKVNTVIKVTNTNPVTEKKKEK